MAIDCFFLGISWILTILIVWFNTDALVHYLQLINLFENTRLNYIIFLKDRPTSYFPDFLYTVSLKINNRSVKFIFKLLSCPFCLGIWLSLVVCIITMQPMYYFPVFYVPSICLFYALRRFVF